ncbi:MAG: CvpA family protein, partial [Dehalococcoidia bacterium]
MNFNFGVNWLDAVILLIFFWLGFVGLTAGLLRSGVAMLAFVVGVFLAGVFYQRLALDLASVLPAKTSSTIVQGLALITIFVAASLAGQLLAVSLKQVAAALFFGPLDQIGGLLFGLAEAFVLIELLL